MEVLTVLYIYTLKWPHLLFFTAHFTLTLQFQRSGLCVIVLGVSCAIHPLNTYIFSHCLLNSLLPVRLIHWLSLIQKFLEIFCMLMVLPVCMVTMNLLCHIFVIHIAWFKQSHKEKNIYMSPLFILKYTCTP